MSIAARLPTVLARAALASSGGPLAMHDATSVTEPPTSPETAPLTVPVNAPGHALASPATSVDPLFLAAPRVATFLGGRGLTNASGFFFARGGRLWLVTSRHVLIDAAAAHHPDRLEIELHLDAVALSRSTGYSMPLYARGRALWRQARDGGGPVDVAVLEIDRSQLPAEAVFHAFTPQHLVPARSGVPAGAPLLVVGFPLGFHDAHHHLPVLRQAVMASPYGIRFQGQGYFLTDARTHRGTSGAPVVMRLERPGVETAALPWSLLGVHSSRMDMGDRDRVLDESLGLNCAWYADILLALTATPT